jgi:hypothetical protein
LSCWSSRNPAHQLVGQRGLAGPAGAGDAEHRDGTTLRGGQQLRALLFAQPAGLDHGDRPGQRARLAGEQRVQRPGR